MTWRDLPATEKQIAVLKGWYIPVPKLRGEASDLISQNKDKLHLLCKTCNKAHHLEVKGKKEVTVKCCGHTERYGKNVQHRSPRSMEELMFEMEHKCTVEEAARFHFGDEAVDDVLIPNR